MGIHRARDIKARITSRMYLWVRGIHAGLVGDMESEGETREVRAAIGVDEGDEAISWSRHRTVLLGKLILSVL